MIKFENTDVVGWEHSVRGLRNPLESWAKSDSGICYGSEYLDELPCFQPTEHGCKRIEDDGVRTGYDTFCVGINDLNLMQRLRNAGTADHRKFMRMIAVYVDITAPLYWWKEFDTYKVGTVANSCSTMHRIHAKPFEIFDFSYEHLLSLSDIPMDKEIDEEWVLGCGTYEFISPFENLINTIELLNLYRNNYNNYENLAKEGKIPEGVTKKQVWWQMIQLLPTSYNQKRTVMMNYEVLANIYKSRQNHKLDEWSVGFMNWIETLPYAQELIIGE